MENGYGINHKGGLYMEENLKMYEYFDDLAKKVDESMKISNERAEKINAKKLEMHDETRPVSIDDMNKELEELEQDKEEFDGMTKDAIINAKKIQLVIRKESEKKYQEALVETMQKQNEIQEKLNKMRSRYSSQEENDIESLKMAESVAESTMDKVKESMNAIQKEHFEMMAKLDEKEKKLNKYAIELNMENELNEVQISDEDIERVKAESEEFEKEKAEQAQEAPEVAEENGEANKEVKQNEEKGQENSEPEKSNGDNKEPEKENKEAENENKEQGEKQEQGIPVVNKEEAQIPVQGNVAVNKVQPKTPERGKASIDRAQPLVANKSKQEKQEVEKSDKEEIEEQFFKSIEINAKDGKLKILFKNSRQNKEIPIQEILATKKDLYKRIEMRKILKEYANNIGIGIFEKLSLSRKINPVIVSAIEKYGALDDFTQYFDALLSNVNAMPFDVKYDLKDSTMEKSNFKLMNKYARHDQYIEGVTAEGIESNWIQKMISKIKNVKLLGKGKEPERLEEPQNSQEDKRQNFLKEQEADKETMEKMEQVVQQYKEEQTSVKEMAKNTHIKEDVEAPIVNMEDIQDKKDEDEILL